MAQVVGKYAANKFLKKHMKGYENKKVETGDVSIRWTNTHSATANDFYRIHSSPWSKIHDDQASSRK